MMNATQANVRQASERVLVVDQDPNTRRAIVTVLISAGFDAVEAETTQMALARAEAGGFDLVVLDLMLEGRAGPAVCEALRRAELTKDVPVLFISAAGDHAAQRIAIEAGGDDFLSKPIHRGELLLRIRSLLQFRRMQRELARSNELLTEQRDALIRLQRQKEELTEIVVHDLKNPLAAIASNAAYLTMATEMNEDVRDCSSAISRAAENMLRMVHNLLDVSRAEEAGLNLQIEPIELVNMAKIVASLMSRRAEERRITLAAVCEVPELWMGGDNDVLRRVFENLLDNAIRYTPSGGRVELRVADDDPFVRLVVADGGPGVPEDQRARIFEKYAQLERKIDKAQQRFGRGIGLAFVKMAVDAHHGQIAVVDNQPRGSCFELRLPKRQP
jgi:two-component system sensor histidine kinase/response regulator